MNKTGIEYLDYTWNPLSMLCRPVHAGCQNCWHRSFAKRHAKNMNIPENKRLAYAGGSPVLDTTKLLELNKKKEPRIIGVQFMGDLFFEDVSFELITEVFDAMFSAPQHKYIILTKRPKRLKEYIKYLDDVCYEVGDPVCWSEKPNPNIYFGVSISTQKDANELIPVLLQIPVAYRIVSIEPLLDDINLRNCGGVVAVGGIYGTMLDHIIIGCESGNRARPCLLGWVRNLCRQCVCTKTKIYVKQLQINDTVTNNIKEFPYDLRIRNEL